MKVFSQFKVGWSSCSAIDPMISMQRSISSMSPAEVAAMVRKSAAQQQHERVTEPLGPNERVGRPSQRLLKQGRHVEREKNVVEDPHDDGIVTRGFGDRQCLGGQSLAAVEWAAVGEFRTQGGEDERPVEVIGREARQGQSPRPRPCRRRWHRQW